MLATLGRVGVCVLGPCKHQRDGASGVCCGGYRRVAHGRGAGASAVPTRDGMRRSKLLEGSARQLGALGKITVLVAYGPSPTMPRRCKYV